MSSALMRGPAAIDRQGGPGDRSRGVTCKEYGDRAELFDRREMLVGLLRQQYVVNDLLARDMMRLRLTVDLRLDQGGVNIAGADRVDGDAFLGGLQRSDLGQADDAVFCSDIGGLEG